MDLRCERCATEYELDDSAISEAGTVVQCGTCGHTFQVRRAASVTAQWWLQTADGSTHQVPGLACLQGWIVEGRVSPQDRISVDGQIWRHLVEIPELASAFAAAGSNGGAHPSAPPAPKRSSSLENLAVVVETVRGSLPRAVGSEQETDLVIVARRRGGRLKMMVGLVVACAVSYAGIRVQENRARRAVVAHSAPAVVPSPAAASSPPAASARPLVQPLPTPAVATPPEEPEPTPAAVEEPAPAAAPHPKAHGNAPRVVDAGESYDALVARARRQMEKHSGVKAQQSYEQALRLHPSGPEALTGLGQLALNRGQLSTAASYYKRAIADRPFPPALFGLGEVYRASGDRDLALQFYKRYLQVAPTGPHSALTRRRISAIQGR